MVFPLQLLQLLVSGSRQPGAARVAQGAPVWAGTRASSAPLSRATAKSAGNATASPPPPAAPVPAPAPPRSDPEPDPEPDPAPMPGDAGCDSVARETGLEQPDTAAAASALWALIS